MPNACVRAYRDGILWSMSDKSFGEQLRAAMAARGHDQPRTAALAGVSQAAISRLLSGAVKQPLMSTYTALVALYPELSPAVATALEALRLAQQEG